MLLHIVSGKYPGGDGTADVMPHAEHGTRDGGKREGGEMDCCQRGGKTAVLHAHLNAYGDALLTREPEQTAYGIAYGESEQVVKHHHNDDQQPDHGRRQRHGRRALP